jgi:hypothetical protein
VWKRFSRCRLGDGGDAVEQLWGEGEGWGVRGVLGHQPGTTTRGGKLPCCLALGFGGGFGVCFGHEVAGQHIGVEANHASSRLAGSKWTGTGGRWLDSIPKPLALPTCTCSRGRSSMWSPTN